MDKVKQQGHPSCFGELRSHGKPDDKSEGGGPLSTLP
jgi:hypothetical protein